MCSWDVKVGAVGIDTEQLKTGSDCQRKKTAKHFSSKVVSRVGRDFLRASASC